ncbi:MAG: GAP family protein [Actinomycetota bacterium]
MLDLIAVVLPLPLALAGAISPVVLLVGLALLSGPRPRLQTGAFAAGVAATVVVLFALGLVAIRLQSDGDEPGWLGAQGAHLVVGLLLITAGIGLALVRPNPSGSRGSRRACWPATGRPATSRSRASP